MSVSEELERLSILKDKGVLSEAEFQQAKSKLLNDKGASALHRKSVETEGSTWVTKVFIGFGILAIIFFGLGVLSSNSPNSKQKSNDRAVINLCWSDHERKDLTPEAKRFIASTCYRLENEFQTKYGHKP